MKSAHPSFFYDDVEQPKVNCSMSFLFPFPPSLFFPFLSFCVPRVCHRKATKMQTNETVYEEKDQVPLLLINLTTTVQIWRLKKNATNWMHRNRCLLTTIFAQSIQMAFIALIVVSCLTFTASHFVRLIERNGSRRLRSWIIVHRPTKR